MFNQLERFVQTSDKDIPLSSNNQYYSQLLDSTEKFINRLRKKYKQTLKTHTSKTLSEPSTARTTLSPRSFINTNRSSCSNRSCVTNSSEESSNSENSFMGYAVTKTSCRTDSWMLNSFEAKLLKIVAENEEKEKFYASNWQHSLGCSVEGLIQSKKMTIKADKTNNIYEISTQDYKKLINNKITESYCKKDQETLNNLNKKLWKTATRLGKVDQLRPIEVKDAFITLKDHKNMYHLGKNEHLRLINPCKSSLGIVVAKRLKPIIKDLKEKFKINQLEDSWEALSWLKKNMTANNSVQTLDIEDYYNKITFSAVKIALEWAGDNIKISEKDELLELILESSIGILCFGGEIWEKKLDEGEEQAFNISMGSYHSAQIADLISLKLAYDCEQEITKKSLPKSSAPAIYRDDIITLSNAKKSTRSLTKITEAIQKTTKKAGFNLKPDDWSNKTNFLDITINLEKSKTAPYRKPNHSKNYVNKQSNHAPAILKQIPIGVTERIFKLTSVIEERKDEVSSYWDALREKGYEKDVKIIKEKAEATNFSVEEKSQKKTRKRRILWYNPPFSLQHQRIGRLVLQTVESVFRPGVLDNNGIECYRIFNRKHIKISPSCLPNLYRRISGINKMKLYGKKSGSKAAKAGCNCRDKSNCPVPDNCLAKNVIYEATVTAGRSEDMLKGDIPGKWTRRYIGSSVEFKKRFYSHTSDIKNQKRTTALANYITDLKEAESHYQIEWKILSQNLNTHDGKSCQLCQREKFLILFDKKGNLLNKKNEICSNCRHTKNTLGILKNWEQVIDEEDLSSLEGCEEEDCFPGELCETCRIDNIDI